MTQPGLREWYSRPWTRYCRLAGRQANCTYYLTLPGIFPHTTANMDNKRHPWEWPSRDYENGTEDLAWRYRRLAGRQANNLLSNSSRNISHTTANMDNKRHLWEWPSQDYGNGTVDLDWRYRRLAGRQANNLLSNSSRNISPYNCQYG